MCMTEGKSWTKVLDGAAADVTPTRWGLVAMAAALTGVVAAGSWWDWSRGLGQFSTIYSGLVGALAGVWAVVLPWILRVHSAWGVRCASDLVRRSRWWTGDEE